SIRTSARHMARSKDRSCRDMGCPCTSLNFHGNQSPNVLWPGAALFPVFFALAWCCALDISNTEKHSAHYQTPSSFLSHFGLPIRLGFLFLVSRSFPADSAEEATFPAQLLDSCSQKVTLSLHDYQYTKSHDGNPGSPLLPRPGGNPPTTVRSTPCLFRRGSSLQGSGTPVRLLGGRLSRPLLPVSPSSPQTARLLPRSPAWTAD